MDPSVMSISLAGGAVCCAVLSFGGAIALFALWRRQARRDYLEDVAQWWEHTAAEMGGTYDRPDHNLPGQFEVTVRGRRIFARSAEVNPKPKQKHRLSVFVTIAPALRYGLEITDRAAGAPQAGALVATGDSAFDRRFSVVARRADVVKRIMDDELRCAVTELADTGYDTIEVRDVSVTANFEGPLHDAPMDVGRALVLTDRVASLLEARARKHP